jgi:hypothetical protein
VAEQVDTLMHKLIRLQLRIHTQSVQAVVVELQELLVMPEVVVGQA